MMPAPPPWTGNARFVKWSAAATLVGLVAWVVGLLVDTREALFAFLTAYAFLTSIVIGALILLMSIHAARSEWPVAVRRLIEGITGTTPLVVVLFLPIATGLGHIYVWAGAEPAAKSIQEAIAVKGAFLQPAFFFVRAVFYLVSWLVPSLLLRRWSLVQDKDGDPRWNHRMWALSGVAIALLAVTLTGAAIDWFMSLTPDWKSSIYGVYFFAGGFLGAFSLLVLLMILVKDSPLVGGAIRSGHFLSAGKYMLAFTIFWTYTAFDQFFIIWIANLPSEASWWVPRMQGWAWVSILLIGMQFVVPFGVLLMRDIKVLPRPMMVLSVWILIAHYLDMYWLILPALHKDRPHPSWIDLAALLLVVGAALVVGVVRASGHALVPAADPRFAVSAAYEGS